MAKNVHARDLKHNLATEHDFIVRRHTNLWLQLICLLAAAFGILFLSAGSFGTGMAWLHTTVLVGVLAVLGVTGYIQVQRHRDLLLLSEFQNALFTSTARLNFRFCLIVKRDGSIVYYDPGFQQMFPHMLTQQHSMLEELFDRREVPEETSREIARLLQADENGVMLVSFANTSQGSSRIVLHIDPLQKPKGYVAIRGREYIERRSIGFGDGAAVQGAPNSQFHPTGLSSQLLSLMLDAAEAAAYATDTQGVLIYANPALHHLLGYAPGQMLEADMSLDRLIYQRAGEGSPGRGEYEGEAVFHQRNGNLVKYFVRQRVWADDAGEPVGSFGYLLPLTDVLRRPGASAPPSSSS